MKRHFIPLAFLILLVSILPDVTHGQSAKEAFRALKKLEARCQVTGMSYQDYGSALADAKFEVNLFLESPEAGENKEFTDSIKRVMSHYDFAKKVWDADVDIERITRTTGLGAYMGVNGKPGKEALRRYPKADKSYEEGGALSVPGVIEPKYLLPIIWNEASEELRTLAKLLPKQ